MTTATHRGERLRFRAIEAAIDAEFGVQVRVAWTFLTNQVEVSRVDGGRLTAEMFASFQRLWGILAGDLPGTFDVPRDAAPSEVEQARVLYLTCLLRSRRADAALRELQCRTLFEVMMPGPEGQEDYPAETECGLPAGHEGLHFESYDLDVPAPSAYVDAVSAYREADRARDYAFALWHDVEKRSWR